MTMTTNFNVPTVSSFGGPPLVPFHTPLLRWLRIIGVGADAGLGLDHGKGVSGGG